MKWVEVRTPKTAAELFEPLAQKPHSFFLDSSSEANNSAKDSKRYSFLGAFPYKIVHSIEEVEKELCDLSHLQTQLPSSLAHIPFLGGAVGFISYEAIRQWEKHLGPAKKEPFHIPDILFGFYDTFFVVDHLKNKIFLISLGLTSQSSTLFSQLQEIAESRHDSLERCSPEWLAARRFIFIEHLFKESHALSQISFNKIGRA